MWLWHPVFLLLRRILEPGSPWRRSQDDELGRATPRIYLDHCKSDSSKLIFLNESQDGPFTNFHCHLSSLAPAPPTSPDRLLSTDTPPELSPAPHPEIGPGF